MEKRKKLALKILKKLEKIFNEEYFDAEGNALGKGSCRPFFEGCLIASSVLFNKMTANEVGLIEFSHICNLSAIDIMMENHKEKQEKRDV